MNADIDTSSLEGARDEINQAMQSVLFSHGFTTC